MILVTGIRAGLITLLVSVGGFAGGRQNPDAESASPKNVEVLIIKAAGFAEGEKPEGPDAITEATSAGGNTHLFADRLRGEFIGLGREAEVVSFNDSIALKKRLSGQSGVRLVIFAGPTYSSKFPDPVYKSLSAWKRILVKDSIVCTCLTSCRFLDSGQFAVRVFNQEMAKQGIRTADGLAILHEFADENWQSKLKAFAVRLSERR
jgi:hypothetical protein